MKINEVQFMYVESCYKISTLKYEKSKINIKISNISHLPFDMFCFSLEKMMTLCQMNQQSIIFLKRIVVKNCENGTII